MRTLGPALALWLLAACSAAACGSSNSSNCAVDSGTPDGSLGDEPIVLGDDASNPDSPGDGSIGLDVGPIGPSPGGTGAFGVVTAGGKQKLYLPQLIPVLASGNAFISVVDVGLPGAGVAGAAALVGTVDLGTTHPATTAAGDSSIVVAASTPANDIWFIDPTTDKVINHITLDATYGQSSFSGGGGYVTGIAMDSAARLAYLGVWNGFAVLDLKTQSIKKVIQAPPSENFGFDSTHQRLYAPFYACNASALNNMPPSSCNTPMNPEGGVMLSGLSVIDLSDDSVYTYEDDNAAVPWQPVGSEPDSCSVDPATQVAIVPAEGDDYEGILDFSKATFDKTTMTVTAPHTILHNLLPEGVAIEGSSHLAFFAAEVSNEVAILNATQANAGSQHYVDGTLPTTPDGNPFQSVHDPHGVGVAVSILGNKPVGFVIGMSRQWVARVDLEQMMTLQQADAGGDGGMIVGPTELAPVVTYLDATTHE